MRAAVGLTVALMLTAVMIVALGSTGVVRLPVGMAGQPVAIDLATIAGPTQGTTCPVDKRYVDEAPEGLRPDVLRAWEQIRAKATAQQVTLCLQDGKRSTKQQQDEFQDYVRRFGTAELARKYVLQPEQSMHVKGIAVDVQPLNSSVWMERNGPALGWCRRYQNEPWHFEYDAQYLTAGCPALLPSATGS